MSFLVRVTLPASPARPADTLRWPILSFSWMRITAVKNGELLCAGRSRGREELAFDKASSFSHIVAPALMMALGPVLTTQPDQNDNRIKDTVIVPLPGNEAQRIKTWAVYTCDPSVWLCYRYAIVCIPGPPLPVAKPRSLTE